jgi:hypothetical protein
VAAIAGGLAGAEPVGSPLFDALWSAAFSVVLVLAASRSRRLPTVVLAGLAGVVGIGGDGLGAAFGVLSLAGAFLVAFPSRRERLLGGLVGLVAGQALLRGPSYGFSGLPTLVAAAAVLPVMVSAYRMARTHERRLARRVGLVVVVVVALASGAALAAGAGARSAFERGADLAETGFDQLRDGDSESAAASFSRAEQQFADANEQVTGPLGTVGGVVPVAAQNLAALEQVSAAGSALAATASEVAATADWTAITTSDGTVDLERVVAMQEPVARSAVALDDAVATIDAIAPTWLVPPLTDQIDRLAGRLVDASDEAAIAVKGLEVAPSLLGGDGPTRWFVAFATPGESRNAGGFAGAYAVLEADGGRLTITDTGSTMSDLEPSTGRTYDLDLPPGWDEIYGGYDLDRFPGNLTASPDWPTDAGVAAQIAAQSAGVGPVDGVIYADPAALAALLKLTGPVRVDGLGRLTPQDAEQYLLVDQYVDYDGAAAERREVLGEVARAVFDALVSEPLPGVRRVTNVLGPAVAGGHLKVWSLTDPRAQELFRATGLAGSFGAVPGADVLSLRSSNLIASKIDAYLHRDVTVAVEIDPTTGEVTTVVDALLRNDAPADGLPDYLIGDGAQVPRGTNQDLLTLYTPLGLDGVEVDGSAVGAQIHTELGLNSFAVPVAIPAGGEVRVVWRLAGPPPAGLVDTGTYELLVAPQPLANADVWSVTVRAGGDDLWSSAGPLEEMLKVAVRPAD